MKVIKHILKWSMLFIFILLVGCSDQDAGELVEDKSAHYDVIYLLHFGNFDTVYDQSFSKELKKELSLNELENDWEEITYNSGDFIRVRSLNTVINEEEEEELIVRGKVEYEHLVFDLRMILDESQEIIEFDLLNPLVNATLPELVVEESIVLGEDSDYKLRGTLTLPRYMQANLPAVVLVQGSGPSDRDESILSYKPFRDIAWGLAEQGIAVIRYDKRTLTYAEEMLEDVDSITAYEETVEDAILASQLLKSDERIDENNVFILGHSLGGMLAPRIDQEGGNFAGIISLAASPRPLWDIVYDQNDYFKDIYLTDKDEKEFHMESVEKEYEKVQELDLMSLEEAQEMNIFGINGYYLKDLKQYDVKEMFLNLDKPILMMQGKDDFQVFYEKDFAIWENLLDEKDKVKLISYNKLNHYFIDYNGQDKGKIEEYHHPGKVSPRVINDIGRWIDQNQNHMNFN